MHFWREKLHSEKLKEYQLLYNKYACKVDQKDPANFIAYADTVEHQE